MQPAQSMPRQVACAEKMTTPVGGACLPSDLEGRAVARLGWFALLMVFSVPVIHFWMWFFQPPGAVGTMREMPLSWAGLLLVLGASAAVCLLVWSRKACPTLMLDLGLIYEVVGAFGIALVEHSLPWSTHDPVRGVSWIALWIVFFGLMVPNSPKKTALAALAAACMSPAGLLTQVAVSARPLPDANILASLLFPTFLAALWVTIMSRFVYRLGRQATHARELGSYRLVEPIGKGGMGEVWRAEHRMLARTSAIKLIRPEALAVDPSRAFTILRRFQREAKATAALSSPHTVELFDFGTTEEGNFYYVMEFLNGMDLESLVSRFGPQPPVRVIHFLGQVCDSLGEAHAEGLIHRDIKPKNIFVCRLGLNYDVVKVLDFGLVKFELPAEETRTQLTMEGITTGTPAYMAPEVAMGKPADARSDLYALGCVGYWLLTGELVFERESAMATALAHVQTAPTPPSQRTELEIPELLERVILSCLEKDPAKRPQTAGELSGMLAACDAGEAWSKEQAERWWRTHLPASAHQVRAQTMTATETV